MSQGPASKPLPGQAPMTGSQPVVLASDQDGLFSRAARHDAEYAELRGRDAALVTYIKRACERANLTDRRGSVGRGSSR